MKSIILASTVSALSLVIAMESQAAPRSGSHRSMPSVQSQHSTFNKTTFNKTNFNNTNFNKANFNKTFSNYHLQHGTKFSNGFLYKGKNHFHWSYCRWDTRYGCNVYYDPCCCCWYYWCQPDFCYYPVTYCPYRSYCCWSTPIIQPVCNPCNTVLPTGFQGTPGPVGVPSLAGGVSGPPMIPEPLSPINP